MRWQRIQTFPGFEDDCEIWDSDFPSTVFVVLHISFAYIIYHIFVFMEKIHVVGVSPKLKKWLHNHIRTLLNHHLGNVYFPRAMN